MIVDKYSHESMIDEYLTVTLTYILYFVSITKLEVFVLRKDVNTVQVKGNIGESVNFN